jgi:hypothetical protein
MRKAKPKKRILVPDPKFSDPMVMRVSWVTIALTGGVPLELVQKVTGHKTTDIVLKHYFQPGREDFRLALQSAMPNLLTNGHKTPKEEMREMLGVVRPVALRERLLKVWAKL